MSKVTDYSAKQLLNYKVELVEEYKKLSKLNLNLDMSRGKPGPSQLDKSNEILDSLSSYKLENGVDARNYGILDGIPELKRLFSNLLDIDTDDIIIGNNSVLNLIYDTVARLFIFGTLGSTPWCRLEKIKFLCPVPGYDRHFKILEEFGIEMINIPMTQEGPDMDMVEKLVASDETIKGIICVPVYSNPDGTCYSDETVRRLAKMKTAASDFRIFWDNAYVIHYVYEKVNVLNILREAEKYGTEDRIYYYFSTSKIMFPGAGVAMIASGRKSITEIHRFMSVQTIGSDKINQLRVFNFLKNVENINKHMDILANCLKPKFDVVLDTLKHEFESTGLCRWSHPKGGYFIALYTLDGCAKATVELAKRAGLILTSAGATHPYGNNPHDNCIRLAPSYPECDELEKAIEIVCVCAKLACVNKLLNKDLLDV